MTRNSKLLGAVLAILVALASQFAASAFALRTDDFETESTEDPYIVTGEQVPTSKIKYKFVTSGKVLECSKEKLNGTEFPQVVAESGLTVEHTVEGCKFGETAVSVDTVGCNYLFTGSTSEEGHAPVHMECKTGVTVKVTLSGCTIEIPEQTLLKGAHYESDGSVGERDITIKVTAENVAYTLNGLFCAIVGGNGHDLSINGTYTVTAYEDINKVEGEPVDFWVEETVS